VTTSEKVYSTEIIGHRWLSTKTFEIRLRRPAAFSFKPGQRISLRYKDAERDYSLASSPDESDLVLCIRYVENGRLSRDLGDAKIETRLSFHGPHGYFTFKPSGRSTVWVASGTGIAPFRAMVRSGMTPEILLHGVETPADLYYANELRPIAGNYVPCLSQPGQAAAVFTGRVTDYRHKHLPPDNYDFYLCGNSEMIRDVMELIDEQFEGSFVYTESFY
jgi:NAD(P)H-flavin reductase